MQQKHNKELICNIHIIFEITTDRQKIDLAKREAI